MEKRRTQILLQLWPLISPQRWPKSKKDKQWWGKISTIRLSKYVKIFHLSRKNVITFCYIWAIFARKQGRVTNQKVRSKIWQNFINLLNILIPTFSSFGAIDHKGHFRKILSGFLSLPPFLGTTPTFFKKVSLITWCRV